VRYGPDDWVAPHIRMNMLACKCGRACSYKDLDDTVHRRSFLFFRRVGELLKEYDRHFKISSGLRCPAHNAEEGGEPNSAHIYKVAVDIHGADGPNTLALMAEKTGWFSAIIVYPWGIHLDVHPDDRVTRGHSYGKHEYHTWPYGNRKGLLPTIYKWNSDYEIRKPGWLLEADLRETP
jgi:hypothetical protein